MCASSFLISPLPLALLSSNVCSNCNSPKWSQLGISPCLGRGQFTLPALFYISSQHKQGGQGGLCRHLTGLFNNNNNNNKSPRGLGQINMPFNASGPITLPCHYACVPLSLSLSVSVCFQIRNCKKCVRSSTHTHTHIQAVCVCVPGHWPQ